MSRMTAEEDGQVIACPECDHAGGVYERTHNGNPHAGDPDADCHCHDCGATFDTPVKRESKDPNQTPPPSTAEHHGQGQVLADMSVEEFDRIVNGEGVEG